jgi:SagB-type dehydrogenase family enzyme
VASISVYEFVCVGDIVEYELSRSAAVHELERYHEATKHSQASLRSDRHRLVWANKPLPFKIYTTLEGIQPPEDIERLCLLSNGVLRWRRYPDGQEYGFRGAPNTGALYHIELYLATSERADLPAGLYHYGADDNMLRRLRAGDVRDVLLEASGGFRALQDAPLIAIVTSTFWRNAWKYQARAYRHSFWDGGVVLANLLALTADEHLATAVVMGFADAEVNHLVGADGEQEAAVALVAIGAGAPIHNPSVPLPDLDYPTRPLSPRPVRYREIEEAQRASSLGSGEAAAAWREHADGAAPGVPPSLVAAPDEVIRSRRSTRRFAQGSINRPQLDDLLAAAAQAIPGDSFSHDLVAPFLIVNAVEGLEPGVYGPDLQLIRVGDFRLEASALALDQELGARAAVNIYFLSDLDAVFVRLSERGYRVAQMAGGIAGGRVELKAVELGLGATGLTFFDDEVTDFFEPASAGRQVMYLVAVGRAPIRDAR